MRADEDEPAGDGEARDGPGDPHHRREADDQPGAQRGEGHVEPGLRPEPPLAVERADEGGVDRVVRDDDGPDAQQRGEPGVVQKPRAHRVGAHEETAAQHQAQQGVERDAAAQGRGPAPGHGVRHRLDAPGHDHVVENRDDVEHHAVEPVALAPQEARQEHGLREAHHQEVHLRQGDERRAPGALADRLLRRAFVCHGAVNITGERVLSRERPRHRGGSPQRSAALLCPHTMRTLCAPPKRQPVGGVAPPERHDPSVFHERAAPLSELSVLSPAAAA